MGVEKKGTIEGIQNIHLDSWNDFTDLIKEELIYKENLIWRGQSQNWVLLPSLERLINDSNLPDDQRSDPQIRNQNRIDQFKNFKFAMRGRFGSNPPDFNEDEEIWALGQHYGLATPLLDWTESPFVAAFFAFEAEHKQCEDKEWQGKEDEVKKKKGKKKKKEGAKARVIISLDNEQVMRISRKRSKTVKERGALNQFTLSNKNPEITIYKPESHFNPNLVSQQGIFTVFNVTQLHLEGWIRIMFSDVQNNPILTKYILPDEGREQFLTYLNKMNINRLTLFPDLGGASEFCNQKIKIKNY